MSTVLRDGVYNLSGQSSVGLSLDQVVTLKRDPICCVRLTTSLDWTGRHNQTWMQSCGVWPNGSCKRAARSHQRVAVIFICAKVRMARRSNRPVAADELATVWFGQV